MDRACLKAMPRLSIEAKIALMALGYIVLLSTSQLWLVLAFAVLFALGLLLFVKRWDGLLPTLIMALSSGIAISAIHWWNGTLNIGILAATRLNVSIWGALLFAVTTSSSEIMDTFENFVARSGRFGQRFRYVPLQAAMVTRFVPLFAEHLRALREARIARGGSKWNLNLSPLVISALRQSDHLADAIKARGFDPDIAGHRGGENKNDN